MWHVVEICDVFIYRRGKRGRWTLSERGKWRGMRREISSEWECEEEGGRGVETHTPKGFSEACEGWNVGGG